MALASSELSGLDSYIAENSPRTIEEALQIAAVKAADPSRKPISRHFGTLPGAFGNGVATPKFVMFVVNFLTRRPQPT
jgi:hypothetical protein